MSRLISIQRSRSSDCTTALEWWLHQIRVPIICRPNNVLLMRLHKVIKEGVMLIKHSSIFNTRLSFNIILAGFRFCIVGSFSISLHISTVPLSLSLSIMVSLFIISLFPFYLYSPLTLIFSVVEAIQQERIHFPFCFFLSFIVTPHMYHLFLLYSYVTMSFKV